MRKSNLIASLFCLGSFLSAFLCQVPGFGNLNSIGETPYPPSSFFPDKIWGVNNAMDIRWPNGVIPYTFDYTSSNPADNITLSIINMLLYIRFKNQITLDLA